MKRFSQVETNLADEFRDETISFISKSPIYVKTFFVTSTGTDEFELRK